MQPPVQEVFKPLIAESWVCLMKAAYPNFLIFPIHCGTYETPTTVLSKLVLKGISNIIDLYLSGVLTSLKSLTDNVIELKENEQYW